MLIECIEHFFQPCPVLGVPISRSGLFASRTPNSQPRRWVLIEVFNRARPEEVNSMASRGVNKVTLVGNLGADPDIRYLPSGAMVTAIRLATGELWKDEDGKQQERTEWHRVVFNRRLAEVAGEFLKKGSKIYVEGSLRTQQWDKNGEKRYTTEVIANDLLMLERT